MAQNELTAEVEIVKSLLSRKLSQLKGEIRAEVWGLKHPLVHEKERYTTLLAALESSNGQLQALQQRSGGEESFQVSR